MMAKWKTIDTAPKDKPVLIYSETGGVISAIRLLAENDEWLWYVGESGRNGGVTMFEPTHYMLLPKPPKGEKQ